LFKQIGDWLWSPLEISSKAGRVLILPEGEISNLPWPAIIWDGEPLVSRHEITLSPSLRHHLHARAQKTRSQAIKIFVGVTEGLSQEQKDYSLLLSGAGGDVVIHDHCRRDEWPDNSQAHLWHYTGHAQLRTDNPFYSSLLLSDGPLFAADFRLKKNRVGLVTLAACRTGQETSLPGEESTGLVRSMLEMGARNVIASHWAVYDKSTYIWMNRFYECFLGGRPVGEAARQAALHVRETYPSAYCWAPFSVFGAG
jgi:CHAT domain-containing protein